mmetsp:Transcript_24612/g.56829  ORF Transcript_24612/g.56829 Transcript_24612/m.56829 type:complete len:200 (+) Transcript_24612:373-972(+)
MGRRDSTPAAEPAPAEPPKPEPVPVQFLRPLGAQSGLSCTCRFATLLFAPASALRPDPSACPTSAAGQWPVAVGPRDACARSESRASWRCSNGCSLLRSTRLRALVHAREQKLSATPVAGPSSTSLAAKPVVSASLAQLSAPFCAPGAALSSYMQCSSWSAMRTSMSRRARMAISGASSDAPGKRGSLSVAFFGASPAT